MSELEKSEKIENAKGLAKWFELDLSIKLFGVTIFHWHYPPSKS